MAAVKPAKVAPGGPCGLHITVAARGATSTIGLAGDWDLTEREAVSDAIAEVLERRPERLVLDLSRLGFIDSSGIHGTIDAHQRCAAQGTGLVIVPGPRAVQRVFEIC